MRVREGGRGRTDDDDDIRLVLDSLPNQLRHSRNNLSTLLLNLANGLATYRFAVHSV